MIYINLIFVQETLWQQALDDVQKEIENKLDKIEISPLKDFVNNKLKALQDRLKALASLKKDSEAAGTKIKLLRYLLPITQFFTNILLVFNAIVSNLILF